MKVIWEPADIYSGLRVRQYLNNVRAMSTWLFCDILMERSNEDILKIAVICLSDDGHPSLFEIQSKEEIAEWLTKGGYQVLREDTILVRVKK